MKRSEGKAYNAERRKDPAYAAKQQAWRKAWGEAHKGDPARKAKAAENMRAYSRRPELRHRHQARWLLSRAIAAGRVSPLPCFVCGDSNAEGHHVAYDMPLDVAWLCRQHHRQLHAEAKATS